MKIRVCGVVLVLFLFTVFAEAETKSGKKVKAKKEKIIKIGHLRFEGGDGSSIEKAVIIKNAKNESEGVDAESKWIHKVHRGWRKGRQALLMQDGKSYDRIEYTTPDGTKKTIFFDITEFFGKF
jgi:hypothetical protein